MRKAISQTLSIIILIVVLAALAVLSVSLVLGGKAGFLDLTGPSINESTNRSAGIIGDIGSGDGSPAPLPAPPLSRRAPYSIEDS